MDAKYKNKYRNASARAQWWDYSWNAAYFVTICTQNREPYLGDIQHGKMILSHVGVLADVLWQEIKHHAKFVELDAFVVMPNHVHGILVFDQSRDGNDGMDTGIGGDNGNDNDNDVGTGSIVGTGHALYLPDADTDTDTNNESSQSNALTPGQKRFRNQGKNTLSSVEGSYKSAVTRHARRLGYEFAWQTRFHDHIIRNEASFQRIATYIENNVINWNTDKFYQ